MFGSRSLLSSCGARRRHTLCRLPFLVAALSWPASSGFAQNVKLNDPLAQPFAGRYWSMQLTPDGSRVVYSAEQELDQISELYVVPVDGSQAPTKLSGDLAPNQVYRFHVELTDQGDKVVYLVSGPGIATSLYCAPLDGSTSPVQLTGPIFTDDFDVFRFRVGPDGGHVVYHEEHSYLNTMRLSSAPTDASQPAVVLADSWFVDKDFGFSPDGSEAVYIRSDADTSWRWTLFKAPVDGSGPEVQLNGPGTEDADSFLVSPIGRVAYRAGSQLYSVPLDLGSAPVRLNADLPPGGSVTSFGPLSPDGTRLLYLADQEVDDVFELYVVPLDGSAAPTRLNGVLVAGGDVWGAQVSPDGGWVVYLADQDRDQVGELYAVPIDRHRRQIRLSGKMVAGGQVQSYGISPDGRRVVYRADQRTDGTFELFSVPIDGGHPRHLRRAGVPLQTRLSGALVAGGDVGSFQFSPDGRWVAYRADQEVDGQEYLYGVPIEGGTALRLNDEPGPGGSLGVSWLSFLVSADGPRVVHMLQQDFTSDTGLYSVPVDRSAAPVRLNPPMARGPVEGDVHRFQVSPDGSRAVYLADQELNDVFELYSVPVRGDAPPVKLNGSLPFGGDVGGSNVTWETPAGAFRITPDGSRVAYVADQDVVDEVELYVAPIDGSAPALRLDSGAGVQLGFQVDADSGRVVFQRVDSLGATRLFSQPLDGSQSPLELDGSLVAGGNVVAFALSPDAAWVVFRADAEVDQRFELYAVPGDGSAPPVRLNDALAADRDVSDFAITGDSARVVFLSNAGLFEQFELYSVPIDGSQPAIELDPAVPGTEHVFRFAISPDGTRVVFVATIGVQELYSVPSDGSAPPVKLNGALVAGGDVSAQEGAFAISPDSRRVVYLADQDTDDVLEIYSVRIDGSSASVKLNGPLVPGGQIDFDVSRPAFRITADSRKVVYIADQDVDTREELYCARIAGAGSGHRINGPLLPGESVTSCEMDPFGFQVVYVARMRTPHFGYRPELYRVSLDGSRPPELLSWPRGEDTGDAVVPEVSPDGRHVVYIADLDDPGVSELYSFLLALRTRVADPPEDSVILEH